jgi:ketosteroid isomerase-like protein
MDCYTDDAVVDFGYGLQLEGKTALEDFYKGSMASSFTLVDPQGHNPEIEILSSTTARGFWQLDNSMVETQTNKALRVGASYTEEYVKRDGEWKISVQKVNHIYRQVIVME